MQMDSVDPAVDDAVRRGAAAYLRFFDGEGRARLWADREYPEDAHSAGTGLSTLALLCRRGAVDPEVLERVMTPDAHGGPAQGSCGRSTLPLGRHDGSVPALVRRPRGAGPGRRGRAQCVTPPTAPTP